MSAKVLHGRRRGKEREFTMDLGEIPRGMQLPGGTDLRQVTVLSKSEWERIGKELNRRQMEQDRVRRIAEQHEELRMKSKEIVKHWGNTIAGKRQKKLVARKLRDEREEAEKAEVDIEEAKYMAQERKEAIEKAKTMQYYQTDRVKGFHGALMLTEVLKEREAQLELKLLKERAMENKEREWVERSRRQNDDLIGKDQHKAAARIAAAKQNVGYLTSQINEHLHIAQMEDEVYREEGQELKKLAQQFELEKERLYNIRQDERRQLKVDNLQQQQDVARLREINKEQEEEEDEECRIFATAKRKMMRMRADKEREIQADKHARLTRIGEKLSAHLKSMMDDEDGRIREAVKEKDEIQMIKDTEKAEKIQKMKEACAAHRVMMMKRAEAEKKLKRREDLEFVRLRKDSDNIFWQNETEKQRRRRENYEKLQSFHVKQMESHDDEEIHARQEQLALDKANVELLQLEEDQFQEYAAKVIDHCVKGGRNVYPLRKAAKIGAGGGVGPIFGGKGGIRPSYMTSDKYGVQMPNYHGDSTEATKTLIGANGATKKRMGFVW